MLKELGWARPEPVETLQTYIAKKAAGEAKTKAAEGGG